MHKSKRNEIVEILSKVFIITHGGKKYYLLDYPQGRFLLNQSEYYQSDVKPTLNKEVFNIKMNYPTRDRGYYRFLDFLDTKPTFRKKVDNL